MRLRTLGLALLLSLPAWTGCSGSAEPRGSAESPDSSATDASAPSESATIHTVRGLYLGPAFDGAAMQVNHEEIEGVMESMTMSFRLRDPQEQNELKPGDKIRFRFVNDSVRSFADRIETLDPNTELDLADD